MSERPQIKRFILRALLRMDGIPMPEETLLDAVKAALPGSRPGDIAVAISELERDRCIISSRDELGIVSVSLTTRGDHKARQLE